ncbi:MAG: DUF3098 domain-containing protein [Bacteroidales bacterium]|nr:DUF3098 domain-containing protein [Bacteroidales bacterium]
MRKEKTLYFQLNKKSLIVASILLLMGFASMSLNSNNPEKASSLLQLTIAPVLLLAGYVTMGIAIMKKA